MNPRAPLLIGIAGDACTGKTTLANALSDLLVPGEAEVISLDGYHVETRAERLLSRRPAVDPSANDLATARRHLVALSRGRHAVVPTYDHSLGDFGPLRRVEPARVVVWEGLHALYPLFLNHLDLRVFCDVEEDLKHRWRMVRDVGERGYRSDVLANWLEHRHPAARSWILPQRESADVYFRYQETDGALVLWGMIRAADDPARASSKLKVLEELPSPDLDLDLDFSIAVEWGDVRVAARALAAAAYQWASSSPRRHQALPIDSSSRPERA